MVRANLEFVSIQIRKNAKSRAREIHQNLNRVRTRRNRTREYGDLSGVGNHTLLLGFTVLHGSIEDDEQFGDAPGGGDFVRVLDDRAGSAAAAAGEDRIAEQGQTRVAATNLFFEFVDPLL